MTTLVSVVPGTRNKAKTIRIVFGQEQTTLTQTENDIELAVKIPLLDETEREECIISAPGRLYQEAGFHIIETEDKIAGALVQEVDFPLEKSTYQLYLDFLNLTKNWNLFRVWHYVPFINEDTDGLENYRSFCKARSLAFEAFYGKEEFNVKMPAASAVGINDNKLVMYFVAGKEPGIHIENPEQVPAFHYPQQYGPRSPSFARGTVVAGRDGRRTGYLSGTASIKSHESVMLMNVADQLHTTVDNMSLVFERMGLVGERMSFNNPFPDPASYQRSFKVYIRHASDAECVRDLFPKVIMATPEDHILYVQSDICRAELDIEIEAIIREK